MTLLELLAGGVVLGVVLKRSSDSSSSSSSSDGAAGTTTVTGYVNGQAVQLELLPIDAAGHMLRADAAQAFLQMQAAAAADGVTLQVDSAFRSYAEQVQLYQLYQAGKGNLAAPPGYSNHEGGVAVDINTARGTNAAFQWLNDNAANYGFHRTVATEPWHWEFV